jgi:hypothetical protein
MSLSPIPLLAADNRSASVTRELELYTLRLETYERGDTDAVPYVPAQTLIRANAEISRLNDVIAKNDVHMANFINARKPPERFIDSCLEVAEELRQEAACSISSQHGASHD